MLHIHRAERADVLAEALAAILVEPPPDPFTPDLVCVPTRGMERWLAQQLSARLGAAPGRSDGVCANVSFPSPGRVVSEAVAAASGLEAREDPWPAARSVWPLLRVVDSHIDEPWLVALAEHVGAGAGADDPRRDRRFAAVRRIAELFDRYSLLRPEMLVRWAAGSDVDWTGGALDPDACWQPELWRALRDELGVPSQAERLGGACERLRAEPSVSELPQRLSLFGLTRLPPVFLSVLDALAAARDVHVFALHPSAALWDRVAAAWEPGSSLPRRSEDPTAALPRNRLLASWGKDSRELQLVLAGVADAAVAHHPLGEPAGLGRRSLLARLQAAVIGDEGDPATPWPLEAGDRSVQVHACHGRARQVEVLRDAILHLFADDPTLEPRDVIVMCPDVEKYAPLVQAAFAPPEEGVEATELRVRVADRSLRESKSLLGVIAALLELPRSRMTASGLLDLADRGPVRRRFGFDDDSLSRARAWAAEGGVRWGLDAAHRAPFQLQAVAEGTWRAGLDRILLGTAMADDSRLFGGTLPLDDVGGSEIERAGALAEFIERVALAIDSLSNVATAARWRTAIGDALDGLTETPAWSGWEREEAERVLDEMLGGDDPVRAGTELDLPEVRALLAGRLAGRPTRASFRTGHLTVCTLYPMRSVPHRAVCLMGLDDGEFPRRSIRGGDDLTLATPLAGDRDPRIEDRQLLLDALLAAGEHLVITYSGANERTNEPRPPAVPLGELLDQCDALAVTADGRPAREQVVVRHPLQPFDARNFGPGELRPGPRGFDRAELAGARAAAGPRQAPPPLLAGPLAPLEGSALSLADLIAFAKRPVRQFLRQRLGIYVQGSDEETDEALPIKLSGLERYKVGQRLVDGLLMGASLEDLERAERARGSLPPADLGAAELAAVRPAVTAIVAAARHFGAQAEGRSLEINLELPDGRLLSGTVPGLHDDLLLAASFARLAAPHRIATWISLLALTAAHPETAWRGLTIGRAKFGEGASRLALPPLGVSPEMRRTTALELLGIQIDLFERGMRAPLPLACKTGAAYAGARRSGEDPVEQATAEWRSDWNFPHEDADPEHVFAFGRVVPLDVLLAELPLDEERGPGWAESEPTRLGRLARRMWDALLEHER